MRIHVIGAALVLSYSSGATAAADPLPMAQAIRKIEIAGVFWGQKESDTKAELLSRGYVVDDSDKVGKPDFSEQVKRSFTHPSDYVGTGYRTYDLNARKESNSVSVEFIAYPDGWRVNRASYWYSGGRPVLELQQAAEAKYKAAGLRVGSWAGWRAFCMPAPSRCGDFPLVKIQSYSDGFTLSLEPGEKGEKTAEDAFKRAIAARKGDARPDF